jgi:hypothetical protein
MISQHLTSEEMEALLMEPEPGDRSPHLAQCELCTEEFESLEATIGELRTAMTASALQHNRVAAMPVMSNTRPRMMWGLAAAAALICGASSMVLHRVPSKMDAGNLPQQQAKAAVSDSDAQLLSNVEDDLSASVPGPMLPLASTKSADTSTNTAKENE